MALPAEAEILNLVNRQFPNRHRQFFLGRGDDCAFFQTDAPLAISSDVFIEDVHFRKVYFTPAEIGYKALAVNLSDLAACAAKPLAFSLALALPPDLDIVWLDEFFCGMASLARQHEMLLCGGDLSRSGKICVSITVLGTQPEDGVLLQRKEARRGDCIFVAGRLGLAAAGLADLEENGRVHCEKEFPASFSAHISPQPLVRLGLQLGKFARSGARITLMDVSDGIASDLPRLLGSEYGARLKLPEERLEVEVCASARKAGVDPALFALTGGEDYALLGACSPADYSRLKESVSDLWQLGTVVQGGGIEYNGIPLAKGFDHFG